MILSRDLKKKVVECVEASISLEQLEEWLAPRLRAFLKSPDSPDANLVAAIELGLAEWSDGLRTQDEVRRLLKGALLEQIYETPSPKVV